jgi:preprotein translocase subunit SecY
MYRQTGASFIPLRVNAAGMIPLIFAFSIVTLPATIATYLADPGSSSFTAQAASWVTRTLTFTSDPYWLLIFILTVGFTFFYALVVHNQQNLAENLQRNGGFIPGIRPGRPTQEYLNRVIMRITWGGALFLGTVSILPFFVTQATDVRALTISSFSLLIMVGVALDTMRQLEAQLLMRNYEGFLR